MSRHLAGRKEAPRTTPIEKGFSLIEVLIVLSVIAAGIAMLAGYKSIEAEERVRVAGLASELTTIADRISALANPDLVDLTFAQLQSQLPPHYAGNRHSLGGFFQVQKIPLNGVANGGVRLRVYQLPQGACISLARAVAVRFHAVFAVGYLVKASPTAALNDALLVARCNSTASPDLIFDMSN